MAAACLLLVVAFAAAHDETDASSAVPAALHKGAVGTVDDSIPEQLGKSGFILTSVLTTTTTGVCRISVPALSGLFHACVLTAGVHSTTQGGRWRHLSQPLQYL